jgi:hypothetical protein
MSTLADITRQIARLITRTVSGTSTSNSGNATTLIDTVGLAGFPNDQFNGGTIWITSGANAGKSRPITDFDSTTYTVTFAAFPSNILSGVTWEICDSSFVEYRDLRQAANLALREIGYITDIDETLTTVEGQTVYTLPAGVQKIAAVQIVTDLGTDEEWHYDSTHWNERNDGTLLFDQQAEPAGECTIRIIYEKFHTELTADADTLDAQVDEQYLVYLGARQGYELAYKRFGKTRDDIPEWLNKAVSDAAAHRRSNRGTPRLRVRTA